MQYDLNLPRRSAAGIKINKRPLPVADPLDPIRRLLEGCGTNNNDKAIVAISALIGDGIDTGPAIVAALQKLSFNGQHAGAILATGRGKHWSRDDDGRYALLS